MKIGKAWSKFVNKSFEVVETFKIIFQMLKN